MRRQVSIYINGKEVENTMKGVQKAVRKTRSELNLLEIGSEDYNNKVKDLQKLNGIVSDHRKSIKSTQGVWQKLGAGLKGYVGIAAAAFTADAIIRYTGKLFELGTEMEVLGKKAQTVFGDALPQVTEEANKNANAMGLTASQYTDAATAIGDLLIPMKFTREEAAGISTNLVNLSGALSEWTGGQRSAAEVSDILSKAMLGEREQLKGLGIAISEADVKNRLAEKGLQNLTGEMLQQAKAAATLELITEKSSDAQAAFAANSDTLVRKQAELQARFSDIQESMASALIPVFHRLLEVAQPVIETFADFVIRLLNGEKAGGKFGGILNFLVTAFQNTGKVVGFVFSLFGKLVDFLLKNFGGAIEFVIVNLANLQNGVASALNGVSKLLNIDITFNKIDVEGLRSSFQAVRKARIDSGIDQPISPTVGPANPNIGSIGPRQADAPAAAASVSNQVDKTIADLDRLKNKVGDLQQTFESGLLPEEEQAIAKIEQKYNAELAKALELTQSNNQQVAAAALEQVLQLEALKEQAIAQEREKQFEARLEKDIEHAEKLLEAENLRFQQEQELRTEIDALSLSDRELELEELRAHYEALAAVAEEFGIDTTNITQRYRDEVSRINKQYNEKDTKERIDAFKAEAQAAQQAFGGIASAVEGFQKLAESTGKRGAALAKTLALVNIAAKSAEAIASGIAASAGVPFPANLAAIGTTVATVLANVATAKNILSSAPQVEQRKMGGFLNVTGADDGLSYNAQYIGSPSSGMLPNKPVVLASEAGPEYFVSNQDLQNPVVLDYVRAIENIRRSRLGQFRDGGATDDLPTQNGSPTSSSNESAMLMAVLLRLSDRLDQPIYAMIQDLTIAEIKERAAELSQISGGVI